jgi:hypothetical protein
MTLDDFLLDHTPLTAVELLPDERLINVVIGDGVLYGVEVDNVPSGEPVTRVAATTDGTTITATGGLSFLAASYTMLAG